MKYKIPPHLRFCRPSPELWTLSCYSLKLLVCFTCRLGPQCDLDGTLYILSVLQGLDG